MRKTLLAIALLTPLLMVAQDKKKGPKTFNLLVGCYSTDKGKSISVYRFYSESGRLAYLSQSDDIENPSYLTVDKDSKYVYAVSENSDGEVYAYSFSPTNGQLAFINKQKSNGAHPCYISVDKDRKNLFVANYSSGNLTVLPLAEDGSIRPASQIIQEKGSGANKDRQEGPHVHTAVLAPDEKHVLYTDLGTDKIHVAKYKNSQKQPLTPAEPPFASVAPGSGPRHIDFSIDKKYLYAVEELSGMVTAFEYNKGALKQIQEITMLADGFKGQVGAADIHVSPDGKFLYASNRGDANEIVVYAIDQPTGKLNFVHRFSSQGKAPRNFIIAPNGNFLLVANQDSNNIVVFKLDKNTGKPAAVMSTIQTGKPVCLQFASAEAKK